MANGGGRPSAAGRDEPSRPHGAGLEENEVALGHGRPQPGGGHVLDVAAEAMEAAQPPPVGHIGLEVNPVEAGDNSLAE